MMRVVHLSFPVLLGLLLAGCSSSVYVPSAPQHPVGYSDAPIRPGYMEVSFIGYSSDQAQHFARLRAADVTAQANFDWFEVVVERTNYALEDVWIPPTYETEVTSTTTNADGTVDETTEEVETAPGYWDTNTYLMSTLLIHLLDHPTPAALNAQAWLQEAKDRNQIDTAGRLDPSTREKVATESGN